MENNTVVQKNETRTLNSDTVLKVTALQYLKETLSQERYEDCAELVRAAKMFGARPEEIREILTGNACGILRARDQLVTLKKSGGRRF